MQVHSVDWSCDGQKLASGSYDRTVCVFSLDKDRLVWTVLLYITVVENVTLNILLTILFAIPVYSAILFEYSLAVSQHLSTQCVLPHNI